MNQNNNDFIEKEGTKSHTSKNNDIIIESRITNKINLLSSEQINYFINKLSSPGFLGSIHLKKETSQNHSLINSVINKNIEYKLSKSFKNPLNNPITRSLVILMILFNVLWIISICIS